MIGSGRCHGPGCNQPAVVDLFCRPACEQAWTAALLAMPVVELRSSLAEPHPDDRLPVVEDAEFPQVASGDATDGQARRKRLQRALWDETQAWLPASSGAAEPQVASEDPQAGWLSKWINRMRRRRA